MQCANSFRILSALLAIFGTILAAAAAEERPKVQIAQGTLEGTFKVSRNGSTFSEFLGIPYGKSERFEDSEFADGWNGTQDASKFGEPCIQLNLFGSGEVEGSETCLFLNVYTPKVSNASNLPVMVFIHGGGFQLGTSAMGGGKYFMDHDVILVTINYRLGPFGFADTGKAANFGLKDQVLALKWVQQNIQQFGGNPNSVTIFGESAGAWSVSYLILSPLAEGLFHRAISQSGTANSPFLTVEDPRREFKKLGVLMDCPTSNPEYLIKCLKGIDAKVLVKPLKTIFTPAHLFTSDDPQFYPTLDKDSKGGKVFLPDTPLNLMRSGHFAKVPWIAGVNTLEGIFMPGLKALLNESRESWDWTDAKGLTFDEHDCAGLQKIRQFYMKESSQNSHVDNMINLFSDRVFGYPTKVGGIFHAKFAPTFLYYFSYKSEASWLGDGNPSDANGLKRPAHGDELQFLMDSNSPITPLPVIGSDSKHAAFSNYFVKLWVDFAKDGEKALEGLSSTVTPWTRLGTKSSLGDDLQWFQIDNESKMVPESKIFDSRLKFWTDFVGETPK